MDQNRPENTGNHQQNVHLHMHHVCNCQGPMYHPAYYPTVGFRTPMPSMLPYHAPSTVARPYLQHYQYTQFNMGSQFTPMPIGHVSSGSSTSVFGTAATNTPSSIDLVGYAGATIKEKTDKDESTGDTDRVNEAEFDFGRVAPPVDDFVQQSSEQGTNEQFIKFLERSCVTAEQIAYRNRNRPCFRNIQNLCIRTRSEILKPCTTISNIHSQGIPWATKDFIYAFVRLTNCWHILKGYWENRDGNSLGKIENELGTDFRQVYKRWEKETMDLAAQLTKIFYNLDTNLSSVSSGANVYAASNLIPPQVNLMKCASEGAMKKPQPSSDTTTTSTMTNGSGSPKNVRGIIHLPSTSYNAEMMDQANQTYATDFCNKEEEFDSEEERARRVYMKPGSYNVPQKGLEGSSNGSRQAIEFLDTAQNIHKAREIMGERYWSNVLIAVPKKPNQDFKPEEEKAEATDEVNMPSHLNVHEWLISSNFNEPSPQPELQKSYYMECAYDNFPQLDTDKTPVTLLQRNKNQQLKAFRNSRFEPSIQSRSFRKQRGINTVAIPLQDDRNLDMNPYELRVGGFTEAGRTSLENMVVRLKNSLLGTVGIDGQMDVEKVLQKVRNMEYTWINEVVRDLRYMIKVWGEVDIHNISWFTEKLDILLTEYFGAYDFSDVGGNANELVGPLKPRSFDC